MVRSDMQPFSPDARIDRYIKIGIAVAVLFSIALMFWFAGWKLLVVPAILLASILGFLGCLALEFSFAHLSNRSGSRRD